MKRYYILLCIFFCLIFGISAQDNFLKDYAPVAPNAASLGKYGDIPVSYHTGLPDISIPIYTMTEGSVSASISLSYHASGIRVQETASWVGLGWALNAGGIITRTVQGAPDERGTAGNGGQSWGWFADGGSGRFVNGVCVAPGDIASGMVDTEPDLFNFNVGGYAGKFFFDSDTVIRLVSQEDLKIQYVKGTVNALFAGWIITDPQGMRYHFGATNSSMLMTDFVEQVGSSTDQAAVPKNSSWYLSKIESADRKDVITFTYVAENYAFWDVSTIPKSGGQISTQFPGLCYEATVKQPFKTRVNGKRLSSINAANGSVVFTGDTGNPRTDLSAYNYCTSGCLNNSALPLKTIEIRAKDGSCLKQFDFSTGYTPDAPLGNLPASLLPADAADRRRLILNSVTEKACGSVVNNKVHTFEYFNLGSMPRRISFALDHWGYYNGKDSNLDLDPGMPYYKRVCNDCDDSYNHLCITPPNKREPVFPAMRNGTIKKITYPTGGSTLFDFEAHTRWGYDSTCVDQTLGDMDWSAYGGGCPSCANCNNSYSERSRSFSQAEIDNGHLSISFGTNCSENWAWVDVYNPSNQIVASRSGNNYFYLKSMGLQAGIVYRFRLNMKGTVPAYARVYTLTRTVFQTNKIVGGLRIKSITTNDGDSDTSNNIVKNFNYHPLYGGTRTSGLLVHEPIYIALFQNYCTYQGDPDCPTNCNWPLTNGYTNSNCPINGTDPVVQLVIHNSALQPMQTTMGSHIGYTDVHVKETNNGRTEYKYNMGVYENGPWKPTGYPFPPPPYDPFVGKLLFETHYSQSDLRQKAVEYQYLVNTTNAISGYGACKVVTLSNPPYSSTAAQFYDLKTGYALIKKIMERNFNTDDSYQEKVTDIGYSTANGHLQKTTEDITDSDGTIYRTKLKYAKDYPCPTAGNCDETNNSANINAEAKAILAMRKRNMVAIPIEQTTWIKRPGWGAFRLTLANYFQFDKVNTNYDNLKLYSVYQVRPATPSTSFTESSISTTGMFNRDAAYAQEYQFRFSDTHGKILSQWKQNDPAKQQYIWSHNNKLPIAKVINAENTEIAYTSFEEATATPAANGNWTILGPTNWNYSSGFFQTGRTSFNIGTGSTITSASLPAGTYVVSFWYRDGQIKVNTTPIGSTAGSTWLYAETTLTIAANATISVTGSLPNTYVDELRLYPADALMRTFSYDDRSQLLLSIADENSVPAHYDYDTWQRLQALRDQDRNILQTYEYNYQQAGAALNDIKSRSVLKTGQTTISQVNALSGADVRRVFQYLDGLGRPIQTNAVAQSPAAKDIISYQTYDVFGREPKQYMPYTYTSNGGLYRTGAAAEQLTFINTFGAGGYGYAETRFEASPLNRPAEQGAPGSTWRIGNGHTLEFAYRGNTVADAVRDFTNNNSFAVNLL